MAVIRSHPVDESSSQEKFPVPVDESSSKDNIPVLKGDPATALGVSISEEGHVDMGAILAENPALIAPMMQEKIDDLAILNKLALSSFGDAAEKFGGQNETEKTVFDFKDVLINDTDSAKKEDILYKREAQKEDVSNTNSDEIEDVSSDDSAEDIEISTAQTIEENSDEQDDVSSDDSAEDIKNTTVQTIEENSDEIDNVSSEDSAAAECKTKPLQVASVNKISWSMTNLTMLP